MIRRGDIHWVTPGRTVGREQGGRRPAVVVQNDINNEYSETTIVALMTTHRFPRVYPTHVEVSSRESGLREPSTVLLEQLLTVSIQRLGNRIGQLTPSAMREVDRALHYSLGLVD